MKIIRFSSALLGAAGVGLGALGAHALRDTLAASANPNAWQTAVFYHLLHVVMVWVVSGENRDAAGGGNPWRGPALCWLAGVVLFSGSIYAFALGGPRWLWPVTPLGGVCFIVGWLWAAGLTIRKQQ
ncbi:DUF423 domain-containing protein [Opitutaceae bacterium TAV4]|nr:DUF423 domain-containing protein [Opitutaceae bacterium TAV4]RRJ99996.1 DUF423 domain-containing protein [Opitutaceae bacterium TAV3]